MTDNPIYGNLLDPILPMVFGKTSLSTDSLRCKFKKLFNVFYVAETYIQSTAKKCLIQQYRSHLYHFGSNTCFLTQTLLIRTQERALISLKINAQCLHQIA